MNSHWSLPYVEWIRSVASEYADVPVYIRQQPSECPAAWREPGCHAFTADGMDLRLRDSIRGRDQWAGRGFAVVVDEAHWRSLPWREQCALLLHELAHDVAEDGIARRTPEDQLTLLEEIVACPGGKEYLLKAYNIAPLNNGEVQKSYHGARFVRAGLHLWWRCRSSINVHAVRLDSYGPQVEACIHALQDELEAGGNLIEVMKSPMPGAFLKLWERE